MMQEHFDIFISYRNDGEGDMFANQLKQDLTRAGFGVYFNEDEKHSGSFPERLKRAIEDCKDLLLILSRKCLQKLMANEEVDWVREEIKYAEKYQKNIIPILIGKAAIPLNKGDLPEDIKFLADLEAILLPKPIDYLKKPFNAIVSLMDSKPLTTKYKDADNLNEHYSPNNDFNITLKKAKNGDSKAMYDLACMYLYEHSSNLEDGYYENYLKASVELKKLVAMYEGMDNIPDYVLNAETILAGMYYKGCVLGEEQSFVKTIEMLKRAEAKSKGATYNFGPEFEQILYMEVDGIGRDYSFKTMIDAIKNLERTGSDNIKLRAGKFYMRYGLHSDAIRVLESIETMCPEAEFMLAEMYLYGLHNTEFKPNVIMAQHYLQRAADSNHKESIHRLGLLYFRGQFGFEKNFIKARMYYKRAAELGNIDAFYDYAWTLRYGIGGDRDILESCKYYLKAAREGHILSMAALARIYQEKECRDYEKAYEWALKAASFGNSMGEFILGNLLFFGRGCEPDYNEAKKYYNRALNHGFYAAKFMIEKINKIYDIE